MQNILVNLSSIKRKLKSFYVCRLSSVNSTYVANVALCHFYNIEVACKQLTSPDGLTVHISVSSEM